MRTQDGALAAPQTFGRSFMAAAAAALAALALAVGALVAVPSVAWAASDDIASGTCGSCDWVVDADGELTISPSSGTSGTLDYMYSASEVPWRPYRTQITSVVIEDGVQVSWDAVGLFQGFTSLVTADVSGLDASTEYSESIAYMFYGCTALESVNLDGLNTSGVEDLSYLFYNCSSLKSLDLSSLETSCATRVSYMFYGCSSLESINFSGFDASLAEYMQYMFYGCSSLESLDLSSFEAMSVQYMQYMFCGCSSLKSVDLSSFDASLTNYMQYMFSGCSSLESLDLSSFNAKDISNMRYMFEGCSSLRKLDLSTFDVVSAQTSDGSLQHVFEGCTGLRVVVLGAGYDFPTSYYDGYLPVPYDETYGYGLWQSDDGTIYEDPADIPGQTAATYTAVFEVESGSGEYVPIWEDDTEEDASGDDAGGDDNAADDDMNGGDDAAGEESGDDESSSDDVDGDTDAGGGGVTATSTPASRSYFTDVPSSASGKWYFDAVYALSDLGYITGYEDGSYGVGDEMTRAQFITILWRMACPDEYAAYDGTADNESGLSDVADDRYYTAAVNWGVANEVVTGYDNGEFGVNDSMTFQDMCLVIARYADSEGVDGMGSSTAKAALADFTDGDEVSGYARAGMAWCVQNELVSGNSDGTLAPKSEVARERVATVLYRAIEADIL